MLAQLWQRVPWWKLVKFVITGGVALGIDVGIYYILTRFEGLYFLFARTLSLGVAILWSFSINRSWTFRATEGKIRRQAPRFLVVILSTSLLSLGLMKVGVSYFHFHDIAVLFVVAVFTTLLNFSAHYFWSYAEKKQTAEPSIDVPLV